MTDICYFDNAATTFRKPPEVAEEMRRCILEYCGNPGRGSHTLALKASEKLYEARERAARLFGCPWSDGVVFTLNATYALNMAINGMIEDGSHVLISDLEHNSVLRPIEYLRSIGKITYSIFETDGNVLDNIKSMLKRETKVIVCTHASNITNRVLPIERIGRFAKSRGIKLIVDGSQSAGAHRIDMERSGISALCMAGHKGLLGPQGVGIAMFSSDEVPRPFVHGGSGSLSREAHMPGILPDRLEGGTMPTPAVAGLCEGLKYIEKRGTFDIFQREAFLMERIRAHFMKSDKILTYSKGKGNIWLFCVRGESSQKTSQKLSEMGVCTRPGLHCAPLAHKTLNTPEDGAVRVSAGPLTSEREAEIFVSALEKHLKN